MEDLFVGCFKPLASGADLQKLIGETIEGFSTSKKGNLLIHIGGEQVVLIQGLGVKLSLGRVLKEDE